MKKVISFLSSKFNVTQEPKNGINASYGYSLLEWLLGNVSSSLKMTQPVAEDWGWYSMVEWKGRNYLIGATALIEEAESSGEVEWIIQINKSRSIKEKILGREKMKDDDPCFHYFKALIESEAEFIEVKVE